jgi:hypothetical protein
MVIRQAKDRYLIQSNVQLVCTVYEFIYYYLIKQLMKITHCLLGDLNLSTESLSTAASSLENRATETPVAVMLISRHILLPQIYWSSLNALTNRSFNVKN